MYGANASKAILGGFVATMIMTMMMYAAPMMGLPKMDLAAMIGSMFAGRQMPAPYSGAWWMGMLMHFINGSVIFALIYGYLVHSILAGSPWLRGLEWGLILWLLAQVVAMPMMGMGIFSANSQQP